MMVCLQRDDVDPYDDGTGNRIATVLFYVSTFEYFAEGGKERLQRTRHRQSDRHSALLCIVACCLFAHMCACYRSRNPRPVVPLSSRSCIPCNSHTWFVCAARVHQTYVYSTTPSSGTIYIVTVKVTCVHVTRGVPYSPA
jgi:hypothetical protein